MEATQTATSVERTSEVARVVVMETTVHVLKSKRLADMPPVKLIKTHVQGLSQNFRLPPLVPCKRGAGGLSTLLFAAPSAVCFQQGAVTKGIWYCFQLAVSFTADFLNAGNPSVWHGVDRIAASFTMLLLAVRSWRKGGARPRKLSRVQCLCLALPALGAKSVSYECAYKGNEDGFDQWHAVWHLLGVPAAALVEAGQKQNEMNSNMNGQNHEPKFEESDSE